MKRRKEIRVSVVEFGDRPCFQMQYRDPRTGRKKTQSSGIRRTGRAKARREAERVAANWQTELEAIAFKSIDDIGWSEFREQYEEQHGESLAIKSANKIGTVLNAVERILAPTLLSEVDADAIAQFTTALRRERKSEDTLASYLATLRGGLSWAHDHKMIREIPKIRKPQRAKGAKGMKGRPITGEEFERMQSKVAAMVGDDPEAEPSEAAKTWNHLLRGLWASGLRLGEAVDLCWDGDFGLIVDMEGDFPMLRIPAEFEKGHRDRVLPIAPEFAELLQETPEDERTGYVFEFPTLQSRRVDSVSKWISSLGKLAGVKVAVNRLKLNKEGKPTVKFASAHDLRRSFGFRWAQLIMPAQLMELMRHASISTTMKYYVGRNAETTAAILWKAAESKRSGNVLPNSGEVVEMTENDKLRQPK